MFSAAVIPNAMMAGFKAGSRQYGVLLDYLDVAVINRFIYYAPRPVGAPKSAKGPPPKLLFQLLQRVHPELRRRIRRAEEVLRDRIWRQDVEWWDRELRPEMAARVERFSPRTSPVRPTRSLPITCAGRLNFSNTPCLPITG
jgi:hypothetical protein